LAGACCRTRACGELGRELSAHILMGPRNGGLVNRISTVKRSVLEPYRHVRRVPENGEKVLDRSERKVLFRCLELNARIILATGPSPVVQESRAAMPKLN